MYSLGISINEIKKPIIVIIFILIISSLFSSFIFSPKTYDTYKERQFNLRNTIQFANIDIANFIKFNKNLTIDFENVNGEFRNILINTTTENEVLIYAEKGEINQTTDRIKFKLINGFRTEIKENKIENLKFDTYLADFPIDEKEIYNKSDPNTLDIFELLSENNDRNYIIIYHRLIDTLIIISLCLYYYNNVIKRNNYSLSNQLLFIAFSIISITIDNLLENFTFENKIYILFLILNLFVIHIVPEIFRHIKFTNVT